jgi:hypothetical protein
MKPNVPRIDERSFQNLLKQMRSMVPFYTPEWNPDAEKEHGQALMKIYLHMLEQVIFRLNQVPEKNFIAFLNMLGIKLRPAQSAKAAVTFKLAEGTQEHVTVPKGTLLTGEGTDGEEVTFETESDLRLTPSLLKEIVSVDATKDQIFFHTDAYNNNENFYILAGKNKQERSLYIGHADLFSLTNSTEINVKFELKKGATGGILKLVWEYWDGERWVELDTFDAADGAINPADTTSLLNKSGSMKIIKTSVSEIAMTELFMMESRWLRCRLKNSLTAGNSTQLPEIDTIRLRTEPVAPFPAELAFNNDIPINLEEKNLQLAAIKDAVELGFVSISNDKTVLTLQDDDLSVSALEKGDFLQLANQQDPPEIRQIESIDPLNPNEIKLDNPLEFNYSISSNEVIVKLNTAIRGSDGANVKVKIQPTKVFDIINKTLVLKRGDKKEYVSIDSLDVVEPNGEQLVDAINIQRSTENITSYVATNTAQLISKINPFGKLPGLFDAFYIASDEAFSKKGAEIILDIEAGLEDSDQNTEVSAVLSWEYWNGKSWHVLQVTDNTDRFSKPEKITFTCPQDIEKIKVNGEEKYWIRVRIIDGDYGKEIIIVPIESDGAEVDIQLGTIHYPEVTELEINYEGIPVQPQHCFSLNNLDVADHITELVDPKLSFIPFKKLPEQFQGLFLGFDKQIVGGPIRILFNLTEQTLTEADTLKIQWFYWKGDHWSKINVQDGTEHLTRKDLLEFSLPLGFKSQKFFGKSQFWIKGNVTEGIFKELDSVEDGPKVPELIGIFPNSTYAIQASVVNDEILGTSDLTANQAFQLLNPLIISQTIFINEPTKPSEDEEKAIIQEQGEDAIAPIIDQKGEILNYRVRWHAVEDFYQSGPQSRHYIVDKRQGIIQFGDGINGLVPPHGRDNIRVSYRYGGGINGNVQIGKISALKNAIPFVNEVTNHLPADGGSDTETLEEVLQRGPNRLKNRDRAVTSEDYAALARNASRKIKRAKCLPNTNADGEYALGHVSVIIVPDTQNANEPVSRLLVKVVQAYLEKYSTNTVSVPRHIDVRGASYIQIIIEVSVVPVSLEASARVESGISEALSDYLHPLTGGKRGYGWEFGKNICCAEIIALLEGVTDVDYVQELVILADGERQPGDIIIGDDTLPFSGEHRVNLIFDSNDDDKSLSNLPFSTCQDQSNEFSREGLK